MKPDYKLEYDCPINIGEMPKCEGGYACSQCEKKVFDYSKMNLGEFEKAAQDNRLESTCGIYRAEQIDNVYGDWRDGVNRKFREIIRKSREKKRFLVVIPFIAGFMMLVGCGTRHACGELVDSGWQTQDSSQTNSQQIEKPNE